MMKPSKDGEKTKISDEPDPIVSDGHTPIHPQAFHPTLAPMTQLGHQNLPLLNQKLQLCQTYTRGLLMMSYIHSELFSGFRSSP